MAPIRLWSRGYCLLIPANRQGTLAAVNKMQLAPFIQWGNDSKAIKFINDDLLNPIGDASVIEKHLSHQIVVVVLCLAQSKMTLNIESLSQWCTLQPSDLVATSSEMIYILFYFILMKWSKA